MGTLARTAGEGGGVMGEVMLSEYERQVLSALEADLHRRQPWLRDLLMAIRLPVALIVLAELLLPPGRLLPDGVHATLLVAVAIAVGSLSVGAARRHARAVKSRTAATPAAVCTAVDRPVHSLPMAPSSTIAPL